MTVSILIPHDGTKLTKAHAFVERWWVEHVNNAELVYGVNTDTPYNRAAAINAAAAQATGDVFIITDKDLVYPGVRHAIQRVAKGGAAWVMSAQLVRLGKMPTAMLVNGAALSPSLAYSNGTEAHRSAGGVVVCRAADFRKVGGLDPRFRGWGAEDTCFFLAMRTLVGKPERRGSQWHLWHQVVTKGGRKRWKGQTEEMVAERQALRARYEAAHGNPARMRRLLADPARVYTPPAPEPAEPETPAAT